MIPVIVLCKACCTDFIQNNATQTSKSYPTKITLFLVLRENKEVVGISNFCLLAIPTAPECLEGRSGVREWFTY